MEAVLTDGGLIITRLVRRDPLPDRKAAVARFLQRWTGQGEPLSDKALDSARTARLMDKHVK